MHPCLVTAQTGRSRKHPAAASHLFHKRPESDQHQLYNIAEPQIVECTTVNRSSSSTQTRSRYSCHVHCEWKLRADTDVSCSSLGAFLASSVGMMWMDPALHILTRLSMHSAVCISCFCCGKRGQICSVHSCICVPRARAYECSCSAGNCLR